MKPVIVIGMKETKNYQVDRIINTTSRSNDFGKAFSPFYLGPVSLYGEYTAKKLENAWQFTKVYETHADEEGNPNASYFEWAQRGWNDMWGHRYPAGKGAVPLYSYWNGERLDYIEARKQIYAPLYAQAVLKTKAFQTLLEIYESDETFALLDFDGYDYLSENMTLQDVLNREDKKMGHAFVLAMLLQYPELRKKYGA